MNQTINNENKEHCDTCRYFKKLIMWPNNLPDYEYPKYCCVASLYYLPGDEGCIHETTSDSKCELYKEKE